ncbi:MAG: DUF2889 domain-containing protein [Gammaproteobacteria bacterium]|nr:MAG: DUF2889 domain-containing protein [Gammaproteobacteria bacterium]
MPLSTVRTRKPIHHRSIQCHGYQREDGLWDIEGHLVDTKSYAFPNRERGEIAAGEPVHEMWLRLTVDDELRVHEVEAMMDASPFSICPAITGRFEKLRGLRIGRGWRRCVNELLGGIKGCTHLVELLGPVGTTAFQTIYPINSRRQKPATAGKKPPIIDSCHALASDSEVVKNHWPEFYNGD